MSKKSKIRYISSGRQKLGQSRINMMHYDYRIKYVNTADKSLDKNMAKIHPFKMGQDLSIKLNHH